MLGLVVVSGKVGIHRNEPEVNIKLFNLKFFYPNVNIIPITKKAGFTVGFAREIACIVVLYLIDKS